MGSLFTYGSPFSGDRPCYLLVMMAARLVRVRRASWMYDEPIEHRNVVEDTLLLVDAITDIGGERRK